MLGPWRSLGGLAVRELFSQIGDGGCSQRVPSLVKIWSVIIRREPIDHAAGQSVHLGVCLLQQIGGVFSGAVKLRELDLRIPTCHRLKSSLSTGPTGRAEQEVDPTWDGLQEHPSLLSGGIRSLALVGIVFSFGHGGRAGSLLHLLKSDFELI